MTVSAEKLMQPARLGSFRIHVTCPAALNLEQTEGLRRSVYHCLIHNTLLHPPAVSIQVNVPLSAV